MKEDQTTKKWKEYNELKLMKKHIKPFQFRFRFGSSGSAGGLPAQDCRMARVPLPVRAFELENLVSFFIGAQKGGKACWSLLTEFCWPRRPRSGHVGIGCCAWLRWGPGHWRGPNGKNCLFGFLDHAVECSP